MNSTNTSTLIAPDEPNLDCITPTSISAVTLPTPRLPDTNIETIDGEQLGLADMLSVLGSGIIIVPFVAILQSIGIGKSLAERGNYKGEFKSQLYFGQIGIPCQRLALRVCISL